VPGLVYGSEKLTITVKHINIRPYWKLRASRNYEQMPRNTASRNMWCLIPSIVLHHNKIQVTCTRHVVIFQCDNMAGVDVSLRQHAVTSLLLTEKIPASDTHDSNVRIRTPAWTLSVSQDG
jgi:hypothetical protein